MGRHPLSSTRKGAANELIAAARMMLLGYAVYFPIESTSLVDFVAQRGSRTLRCQVKTAHKYRGRTMVRTCAKKYPGGCFDRLIVVGPAGEVWCIPWKFAKTLETLTLLPEAKRYPSKKWRLA